MNTSVNSTTKTNESESENNEIKINYDVTDDWKNGYTADFSFTNNGNYFEDWVITFETDANITKFWNTELVSQDGNKYTVKAVDWNDYISEGETTTFGFKAEGDDEELEISNVTLNGQSVGEDSQSSSTAATLSTNTNNNSTNITNSASTTNNSVNQLSSDAIYVGFENHSNGTTYNSTAQEEDWDVLWSDDSKMNNYSKITNEEASSGKNSLQITHSPNQSSGGSAAWQVPEQDVYYLQYDVKFEEDYDFNGDVHSGGKLPGLSSSDGQLSGGQTATGSNGFTTRYMWDEDGRAKLYVYHMDNPGQWGESFYFEDESGNPVYFQAGEWHEITQRVEINDGDQKNGSVEVWMDDEKVLDIDGLQFVDNGSGIDAVYFSNFHGGNDSGWYPDEESHIYYDDFIVSPNAADVGL